LWYGCGGQYPTDLRNALPWSFDYLAVGSFSDSGK
jgi:hypothetical protein